MAVYETPEDSPNNSISPSKDSLSVQGEKSKKLLATRPLREKTSKPNEGQLCHKGTTLEIVSDLFEFRSIHTLYATHRRSAGLFWRKPKSRNCG